MNEGKDRMTQVIYFINGYICMNYVYMLPNKQQETVLNTIIDLIRYIKRQYNKHIYYIKMDNEKSLGKQFDSFVVDEGI